MATETEMTAAREPGPGQVPVLVTRFGGQQRIFPVGAQVRVGRDPAFELVSVNPLVSRQCHGLITSDQRGATYVDQSRRGTFLDGKQLNGPLRITESVVLRLGDPATGEELGITPPLTSAEIARNHGRRILGGRMRRGALAGVAVAAVAGLATFGFFTLRSGATGGGGPSASVLRHAESATVRLLMGSPAEATTGGSGTLISPTGLILTNTHVARPDTPGLAVAYVTSDHPDPNPPYLTVEMTTGPSSPAVARYRARPVAVDGYLDLSVVQIYATIDGKPVNPGSLHLPYLTVGNVRGLQLDQPVTVLGFPSVADSESITVTSGVLSTFVPDPMGHVTDPRFELETTARVAHGNSGGAAIDSAGHLIGVPSAVIPGEGSDTSWRLRSVAEARTLIAAARSHTGYHSKILVPLTGAESVPQTGVGATKQQACSGNRTTAASASAEFGFRYSGFPRGADIALGIVEPDGTPGGERPVPAARNRARQQRLHPLHAGGRGPRADDDARRHLSASAVRGPQPDSGRTGGRRSHHRPWEGSHMSQQLDTQGEAHEALGTAVASYGQRVLSDPHTLGNLVADLLPDLPRERSLLVTGAEAGIAGEMRQHVEEQHIDPDTAVQLVARALSERRAIDPAAGMWVASEYAQALGYQVRPHTADVPPGGAAGRGGGGHPGAGPAVLAPGRAGTAAAPGPVLAPPPPPPAAAVAPPQPWVPAGQAPQSWPPAGARRNPGPGWAARSPGRPPGRRPGSPGRRPSRRPAARGTRGPAGNAG